jgi:hypothetical protein
MPMRCVVENAHLCIGWANNRLENKARLDRSSRDVIRRDMVSMVAAEYVV